MKIIRFSTAYFRQHTRLIITLCVFAAIFTVVFSLYNLETEAVLYAVLLCTIVGLLVIAIDFALTYKKHLRLTELNKNGIVNSNELPAAIRIIENDYITLLENLLGEKQAIQNAHSRSKRSMEEYYTLWAHQIKSPVAAMRLLLQSEENSQNAELTIELFKIEQYVEMVLSYIRLESETNDFLIKRYPLEEIVRSALRKYAAMFVRKKIALDLHEISGVALTDEKWLAFVIEQILSNALKYTSIGKITIYTADDALVIEDTGIGIAAEDLPRVGQKGYTGYNGRSDKKATGIGLFLCKTICQSLGHILVVESQIGVGTKVSIGLKSMPKVAE